MESYDPQKIEPKWQDRWKKAGLHKTVEDESKPKCYVLDMFPYPSGEGLHVGHPKGYIATDIYSRHKRMQGFNILHPMGWDAFGLPAEQYAIKNKVHPRVAVEKNTERFKQQLSLIGFNYDWEREINTTDPEYYKWTQWMFLKMFKKGLAYESYEPINWCPTCQTGLANEDLEGNACERCGTVVEKRPMRQWILRITDYAEKLLDGLPDLDWPESIKESQRNWIGKSEGAEIEFSIKNHESRIKVFTTRPDTLFGATYMVLAPEHTLIKNGELGITNQEEVDDYIEKTQNETELERIKEGKEKTGVELKGVKAINPANGDEIPVWIADYVLGNYGTGAIMAVPAHDERDFEFAQKFELPIESVIIPPSNQIRAAGAFLETPNGTFLLQKRDNNARDNAGKIAVFGGGKEGNESARECLDRELKKEVELDTSKYELRYIGTVSRNDAGLYGALFHIKNVNPDNLVLHEGEKIVEMSAEDVMSSDQTTEFTREAIERIDGVHHEAYVGEGALVNSAEFDGMSSEDAKTTITEHVKGKMKTQYKLRDWVFSRQRYWGEPIPIIHCEKCGPVPVPEEDLPVLLPDVERYEPTGSGESPLALISDWVSTTCPKCAGSGKRETNTMPQWAGSSWYYLRFIDTKNGKAFVNKQKEKYWMPVDMYVGGAEHATRHLIYARFWHKFLFDEGYVSTAEPFKHLEHVGLILAEDGRKMSKRWGNVINPDDVVKMYGADTLRIYEMFMGPFSQSVEWSTDSIIGSRRFLEKIWRVKSKLEQDENKLGDEKTEHLLHKTIKKVGEDIGTFKFNTAVSSMMTLVNEMEKATLVSQNHFEMFLRILAPFAPHISEELWESLSHTTSITLEPWPEYDPEKVIEDVVSIGVQVNGKLRDAIDVALDAPEEEVKKRALALPAVIKWTEGKEVKKVIYVRGKIVSVVVSA